MTLIKKYKNKHTLLVGPLVENPDGISMAFHMVVKYFSHAGLPYKTVNTGSKNQWNKVGFFTTIRTVEVLKSIIKYFKYLVCAEQIYHLVGLSILGFIRDFLIIWPARLARKRIVIHVHSGGYGQLYNSQINVVRRIILITLKQVDAIIVLGKSLRFQFNFLPDANKKIHVVPNGLPFKPSTSTTVSKKIDPSKQVRLIYLSNFIESKGYLDCLNACSILHHQLRIPVYFDFCGRFIQHKFGSKNSTKEEQEKKFRNKIETLKLDVVTSVHGVVSGNFKEKLLRKSHILILPTYYEWEGQPLSIIEALAFGTPVISTYFRGIPELVINNHNGFLINSQSPTEIAECVEKLWNDPGMYHQFSLYALNHFSKHFTQKAHFEQLIPIIFGK